MDYKPVAQLDKKSIETIDEVVETILGKDKAAFTLRDRQTGELFYTYRGDHLMRSASNMKIISGAAVLEVLGADYQFTTEIYTDGTISNGVLNGNVYIKGSGDPTLGEITFAHFAQVLLQKGIQKITGKLLTLNYLLQKYATMGVKHRQGFASKLFHVDHHLTIQVFRLHNE